MCKYAYICAHVPRHHPCYWSYPVGTGWDPARLGTSGCLHKDRALVLVLIRKINPFWKKKLHIFHQNCFKKNIPCINIYICFRTLWILLWWNKGSFITYLKSPCTPYHPQWPCPPYPACPPPHSPAHRSAPPGGWTAPRSCTCGGSGLWVSEWSGRPRHASLDLQNSHVVVHHNS